MLPYPEGKLRPDLRPPGLRPQQLVVAELTGLSDQQIRQRHVPSATTLGGLAKHLAAVEREWFQVVLARRPADELDAPLPDNGWTLASDDTAEKLLAGYERACAASRQVAAGNQSIERAPTQCRFVWHVGLAPGRLAVCQKSQ